MSELDTYLQGIEDACIVIMKMTVNGKATTEFTRCEDAIMTFAREHAMKEVPSKKAALEFIYDVKR